MRWLIIYILIFRWGFAPINSTYQLKLVQNGLKKEVLSEVHMLCVPFYLVYPVIMTTYFSKYIKLKNLSYQQMMYFFVQILEFLMLQMSGQLIYEEGYLLLILAFTFIMENCLEIYFAMIRITFINSVAAPGIEGAYITVIASVDNIGSDLSTTVFQSLANILKFEYAVLGGWIYSMFFILGTINKLEYLSKVRKGEWDLFRSLKKKICQKNKLLMIKKE